MPQGNRQQVQVARPVEDRDGWFSILALHQNRLPRGVSARASAPLLLGLTLMRMRSCARERIHTVVATCS